MRTIPGKVRCEPSKSRSRMLLNRKLYSCASRVCAFAIFPNPIAKAILQLLLLLARGDGLRLIYGAVPVLVLVVGRGRAPIQRLLDQLGRTEAGGTVGRSVVHDVLRAVVEFDRPGRDGLGVSDFHARAGHIQ